MIYQYIIPDVPPSLNKFAGRNNTWEYRKLKKQWKDMVMLLCRPRPAEPIAKAIVRLHYVFPNRIRHDPDNYNGKMILDGLTAAGIIVDDSFDCIKLELSASTESKVSRTVIEVIA